MLNIRVAYLGDFLVKSSHIALVLCGIVALLEYELVIEGVLFLIFRVPYAIIGILVALVINGLI